MNYKDLTRMLSDKGLKVTPQRVAVLETLYEIKNHPTADEVRKKLYNRFPSIAIGTIYNILDTFCEHGIIKKVKTDSDFVRYDVVMEKHHHIYCENCNRIEDYYDPELDDLLEAYFERKQILNFQIKEFSLQIIGNYNETHHKPNQNK